MRQEKVEKKLLFCIVGTTYYQSEIKLDRIDKYLFV